MTGKAEKATWPGQSSRPANDREDKTKSSRKPGLRRVLIALSVAAAGTGGALSAQGGNGLFVNSKGNVGIGTDDPTAALEVNGKIFDETGEVMPKGAIIMWNGDGNKPPKGWALCDGARGTPDLSGRFIVGAVNNDESMKGGKTGEADVHSHATFQGPATLTTNLAGRHDHQTATKHWYRNGACACAQWAGRSIVDANGKDVNQERTSSEGDHPHTLGVGPATSRTGNSDGPNRPRWYAMCFIMKL